MSKILIRPPQEQHRALKGAAARTRRSLNSFCILALEAALGHQPVPPAVEQWDGRSGFAPLDAIIAEFDRDLEGIAHFGSAARKSAGRHSDIDLLLVPHPASAP